MFARGGRGRRRINQGRQRPRTPDAPWEHLNVDRILAYRCADAVESLEQRFLLSGAHDAALVAAVQSALSTSNSTGFSAWSHKLTGAAALGKQLPVVGTAFGSGYDPQSELNSLLSRLSGSYTTLAQLSSALEGTAGLGDGVQVVATHDNPDDLQFDLKFNKSTSVVVPVAANYGGVNLDLGGSVTLATTLDFTLTLGAYWDGSQAQFYVANSGDQLNVSAGVSAASLNATAHLGFVQVNASGGSVTFSPAFAMTLNDPGAAGGAGRITLGELNGTTLSSLVNTNVTGPAASVSANITSSLIPASKSLSFSWSNISDTNSATTNLNTDPLMSAYKGLSQLSGASVKSAIQSFTAWTANIVTSPQLLASGLPIFHDRIGELANLSTILKNRLVDQVGTFTDVDQVRAKYASESDLGSVTTTLVGNELRFSVGVHPTVNGSLPIDTELGSALHILVDAPPVSASATINGTLNFGFDLTTGGFFLNDSSGGTSLTVGAAMNATNINATGGAGFAAITVTGGSAAASANIALSLTAPSAGHLTAADFAGGTTNINQLVGATVSGSASVSLPISSPLLGIGSKTFTATWPDFTSPASATTNASDFLNFQNYENIQPQQFSQGLDRILDLLTSEAASSALFNKKLPLVNQSAADLVNINQFLHNVLTQYTDAVVDADGNTTMPFHDSTTLLNLLKNLPGVGPSGVTAQATANDIRYTLHKTDTINKFVPFSLGIGSQVALDVSGTINATLSTTEDITFGVDTSGHFFIVDPGSTPIFKANLAVTTNLNASTSLGFLGVSVTGGKATMGGSVSLNLHDPATDSPATPGIISWSELAGNNIGVIASASVAGSASVSLPLSTTLFPDTATLTANWGDITNPATFTVNTAAIQKFYNFNNIGAGDVLSGLQQLPAMLAHLADSGAFGKNLQFIGSSLANAVGLGNRFQNVVNALGSFTTIQQLASALQAQLGGAANAVVTVTPSDLEITLAVNQSMAGQAAQFNINKTLSGTSIGFQANGSLSYSGNAKAGIQLGLAYGSVAQATDRFYIITGANSQASASFGVTGNINTSANLGFTSVGVNGTAAVSASLSNSNPASVTLPLVDGYNNDGKITLTELLSNPALAIGTPTTAAAAQLVLNVTGLSGTGPNPTLSITWGDITDPSTINVTISPDLQAGINNAIGFNTGSILAGIQQIINLISAWGGNALLNTKIPLINKTVKQLFDFVGKATSFFNAVKNANISTPSAFDSAVNNAIAAAGLPAGSVSLTPQGDNNPGSGNFHYLLDFHYALFDPGTTPFDFGSSLFSLAITLQPKIDFNAKIEFGINKTDGFYIVDRSNASNPEVTLKAGVTANFDKVGGQFGPLNYGVASGSANINFNLGIDLKDPKSADGSGGKIGGSELVSNLGTVLNPVASGGANIHLPIGLHLGQGGPGVATTFDAHWDPADPANIHFGASGNSTDPADGFGPVNFEMGDFIRGIIGPVIHNIQQYNPLPKDLVDFMNKKLPVFNETPAELLGDLSGHKEIGLLFKIADVINQLGGLAQGGTLNLSPYFSGESNNGTTGSSTGGITGPFSDFLNTLKDNYDILLPVLENPAQSIISILLGKDVTLVEFNPGRLDVPYDFPGISVNVPLFSIGIADVEAAFRLSGGLDFYANVDIGLSSRGLTGHNIDQTPNLLDGFFIGDTKPGAPNGQDAFEVGLQAHLRIDLGGTVRILGINAATITGYIQGNLDLGLDLADIAYKPNNSLIPDHRVGRTDVGGDNKVYLDEISWLASNYGIPCTLTPGGQFSITGGAHVEALCGFWGCLYSEDFPLGTQVLLNWDLPCDPLPEEPLADIIGNALVMRNDSSTQGKQINVNIIRDDNNQPYAVQLRKDDDSGTQRQTFTFAQLSAAGVNTIVVNGTEGPDIINLDPNLTKFYNFQFVTINGFGGKDRIDTGLIDPATSHLLATTISAGDGNDTVIGTFANDLITGGAGDDQLNAGDGNDTADGGDGNDHVFGGKGDDSLTGGDGADFIDGADGNNTIGGGAGDDSIGAGVGDDLITGGDGNDVIIAGDGNNTIGGDLGNDTIAAGIGNDCITGGGGDDSISGDAGNDTVDAGAGNDYVESGLGDDLLFGGSENDRLYSGEGNDVVHAGSGTDFVDAAAGNDLVFGDTGDKTIYGRTGNDTIYGGAGNNFIDAGTGNDYVVASTGSNTVFGQAGDDFINAAGTVSGTMDGGDGNDLLVQAADRDQTLSNTKLSSSAGDIALAGLERIQLTGGAGSNRFDVSGFNVAPGISPVTLIGGGGIDTVVDSANTDYLLNDTSLIRASGTRFVLVGITRASLTGGSGDNAFDVSGFNGTATLTGGGGTDKVIDSGDSDFFLANTSLMRSSGGTFTLAGIARALLIGGPSANNLYALAYNGNVTMLGQGGNDTLGGGFGDDSLDGGTGSDSILGGDGKDAIVGGGAAGGGDTIDGGAGDDLLIGSDDGADSILGSGGNDQIYGLGGNDTFTGSFGNDSIDGGAGNDLISGDAGADLLVGGPGNDTLYGQNASASGDDNAVDTLYGDLGTNGNEPGQFGDDVLFGQGGNDLLFGEGGTNTINPGGGSSNYVDPGNGGSTGSTQTPVPPPLQPTVVPIPVGTLPSGADGGGRWGSLADGAASSGVSNTVNSATDSAIATSAAGTQYLAWADNRSGNYEIYVAKHTAGQWLELAGSAHGGGISGTATSSRRPAITIDGAGNPIVAWTEQVGGNTVIKAARYDPTANGGAGGWVALPNVSNGTAGDNARIVSLPAGPVVAWLDSSSGPANVYAAQFNGTSWIPFGAGSNTGNGVSASATSVSDIALTTDGTKVAAGWTKIVGAVKQVFAAQNSGGTWQSLGQISNTAGDSQAPSLAYLSSSLFAAWQVTTANGTEIFAAKYDGIGWVSAGTGSNSGAGVSNTHGGSTAPRLASGGGQMYLVWVNDRTISITGNTIALYARRWNGTSFAEQVPGDASGKGINPATYSPAAPTLAVDSSGKPFIAFADTAAGQTNVYGRGDTGVTGTVYYVNDGSTTEDGLTTVAGAAGNNGLTPATPALSVAQILAAYALNPGDVIVVDTGDYTAVTLNRPGVSIIGAPNAQARFNGLVTVSGANGATLRGLQLLGGVSVTGSSNVAIDANVIRGAGVTISGGTGNQVTGNAIQPSGDGVTLAGGTDGAVVSHNDITGGGTAIKITGATNVTIRDNHVAGAGTGLSLGAVSSGTISGNDLSAGTGISITAAFTGSIDHNEIHDGSTGVVYGAAAPLNNNRIRNFTTGVSTSVAGPNALGYLANSSNNQIFANTTGVQMSGAADLVGQHVYSNTTGVAGTGTVGSTDFTNPNLIELNGTGVNVTGTVQFNRIARNNVGIAATSGQQIVHNLVYRNTTGVAVVGRTDVRIVQNTFYTPAGDNVSVSGGSQQVEVRNNILWTESGYDLNVADDSHAGFFSDFNDLYATGSGKLVHYFKDFSDVLDWQADVNRFDLHSIGATVVNPRWAEPRFVDKAIDDYRVIDIVGGQRSSSPTIDSADQAVDVGVTLSRTNLLTNPGFEAGATGWSLNGGATVGTASPPPWDGTKHFATGGSVTGFAQQTIDLQAAGFNLGTIQNNVVV
ncbi:MAG TPA: NosD domain-containing protein, partial [Tepidisphaeraceae bacterium]